MSSRIAIKTILALGLLLAQPACDKDEPIPTGGKFKSRFDPDKAKAQKPKTTTDTTEDEERTPSGERIRIIPRLNPQLTSVSPPLDVLAKDLKDKKVGKLHGELFGKEGTIHGVVRSSCGRGTVLQLLYSEEGEDKLFATPPILVKAFDLPLANPIKYRDYSFDIVADFEADSPERLAGKVDITYEAAGKTRTYISFDFDTKPLATLLPPDIGKPPKGVKQVPTYPECLVSGYFAAFDSKGRMITKGLLSAIDVKDSGVPVVSIPFSEQSSLRVMVITPKPNAGIEEPFEFELKATRKPHPTYPGVLIDTFHFPEITDPARATTENIGVEQTAIILEGSGSMTLKRDSKKDPWRFDATFENLEMPATISGALSSRIFAKLKIYAELLPQQSQASDLPEAPDWYAASPDPEAFSLPPGGGLREAPPKKQSGASPNPSPHNSPDSGKPKGESTEDKNSGAKAAPSNAAPSKKAKDK